MYVLIFLLWIVFNGNITLEILLFGLVLSAAVYAFTCKFLDWSLKKDLIWLKRSGLFLHYIVVLIMEIAKANFATIRITFLAKYVKEPVLVTFQTTIKGKFLRVLLANSITLTPGTITVSLEDDVYVVHCLDKDFAQGMENSIFVRLLEKMEKVGV